VATVPVAGQVRLIATAMGPVAAKDCSGLGDHTLDTNGGRGP
jgi:hypothetical protein